MANNRLPVHKQNHDVKETGGVHKEETPYNFTKQLLIYAGVTVLYAALMIGGVAYGSYLGGTQQMQLLIHIALTFGFLYYLKVFEYDINFSMKIYDNKCLYMVCSLITLMVIANFHPMVSNTSENIVPNIWLFVSAVFVAVGEESVYRAFGDFNFKEKTVKEETAMVVCYGAFYLYYFVYGTMYGIFAFVTAIGVGALMTGLYLRYRKLGANMALHFLLYYMVNVTEVNSTSEETTFGKAAPAIVIAVALGMAWYGIKLIKAFNEEGMISEKEILKKRRENPTDMQRAFDESKEKYQEKVREKAEPKVEASRQKYMARQEAKNEKRRKKQMKKDEKEHLKTKGIKRK